MAKTPFGELGNILRLSQYIDARNIRGGVISAQELVLAGGVNGIIRSENFSISGQTGWGALGDGSAYFFGDITIGADAVVSGDIVSSNWNGASPLDLSGGADETATAGFAFDSSVGAAQFTGPVYFQPDEESVEGSGTVISLSDTFFIRVYQDNPTSGEDSLYIGPGTNNLDHIVLGPPGGSDKLKNLRFKTVEVEVEGTLRFDTTPGAANEQIIFDDVDYSIYQDNTGDGADNSRLWFDAPDGGQVVFGPRAGSQYLDRFDVLSDAFRLQWEDSGGDVGIHTWPTGIVYDWDFDTTTGEATSGAYPSNITGLACTVSVPTDIACTVLVWGHIRYDHSADSGEIVFFEIQIGGTAPVLPAASEMDLTTSAAGTGNTGNAGTGNTGPTSPGVSGLSGNPTSGTAHVHTSGSYAADSHTHTGPSHNHSGPSHTHPLSAQFKTIPYVGMRSFTPTGSTLTIQAVGGGSGSAVTYDDGLLMAMVLVN